MFKYMMFEEIPESSMIMKPDGAIRTNMELKIDYPIFNTNLGVIGFSTDEAGSIRDPIIMGFYGDIYGLLDSCKRMGHEIPSDVSNSEKCAIITELLNNPINEEEEALDAYLEM